MLQKIYEWVLIGIAITVALLAAFSVQDARAESILEQMERSNDATKCVTIVYAYAQGMWFYGEGYDNVEDFPLPETVEPNSEDSAFFLGLAKAGWTTMKGHLETAHQADLDNAKGTDWEGKVTFNRVQGSIISKSVAAELGKMCNAGGGWAVVKSLPNIDPVTEAVARHFLAPGDSI